MKQRIKLLLLIPHLGGGGAERVISHLARQLTRDSFDVHLCLITDDRPGAEQPPDWVTVHRFGLERVRQAWLPLLRLIRTQRPELVLSGMAHVSFLLLLLKPWLPSGTQILVRQNTTASAAATSWLACLPYRLLYPHADAVLCQSSAMARDLALHFGISEEKLQILANPIELNKLDGRQTENASHSGTKSAALIAGPRLLAVGRLAYEKGYDLLLQALVTIRQKYPHTHLTLLGIGPAKPALHRLCRELQLESAVDFTGYENPAAYYAASTLFVLPSRYEGMPNALLEAAAAGLPLVATPCCSGVADLLEGSPGTWLAAEVSADSLAQAILTALISLESSPRRFHHSFLAPFAMDTAIVAYTSVLQRFGDRARRDGGGPQANKHVAMLIPTLDQIGGAESQILVLAKELAARGWPVTLIVLSSASTAVAAATGAELASANVQLVSLGMRKAWIDPRGWRRYLDWHRRQRPAILHTHLPHATWFARWSRLLAPTRVLIDTVHTSKTTGKRGGPSRQFGYRLSNWLTNLITCVGYTVAESVLTADMAPANKLVVIPNGVILPPKSNYPENRQFQWIAVGRLAPVKDYPTLLRAFAQLTGAPKLTIAGAGPEESNLRKLTEPLGIETRVNFAGFHADIQPLLAASDAFVLSSLWEGLPISVLEASAASLPVVATDAAGTREAVKLEKPDTGILVPVADPKALAEAMQRVMDMPHEQRRQMGANGRQFVEQTYALPKIVDRWQNLYTQLLSAHHKPSRTAKS